MTSLCYRLHTLFNVRGTAASPSVTKCHKLQKMVDEFKKSSQSPEFRALKHKDYFLVVRRLKAANQLSMVEDIVEHQKKFEDITNEQFTTRLILLYGRAGMFEHAHKLFDEMTELKCERTVRSFNALLSACIDAGKYDKLEEILRDFPDKLGITPDVISFNTLIKGYFEMGKQDSALLVLDEMEKRGMEPDLITFNTLLNGFYGGGNLEQGEEIWGLMESKNIVPNVRSYNSRLRGLVSQKRMTEAVELFGEMEEKGVQPDVISFNAVITGFCVDDDVEKVYYWYLKLRGSGYIPDRVTYVTLIPFFCRKDDFSTAHELCIEIINQGLPVRSTLFQPVVNGLVKQSKVEEAKELVELGKSNNHLSFKLSMPFGYLE
ncbi:pentatricopeptide repeat-containing protein At3g13150-like [Euphorbia lathyris]|uniref:pentatricopeptide repeat-containing protein At3g13150-like n=1 Tax=Euphorbia lathyris TaxID=212925 RepID=UPI00331444AB